MSVPLSRVGDGNGHHQERLGSTTTNHHGVEDFNSATVFGGDQLVVGPTHGTWWNTRPADD